MTARHWWQDAVVYQIYLRSFCDSDGDGVGDIDGIRRHLDDIAALGVDALWLNPCYPSPQLDHGYDVADYFDIHHEYGTLDTFDALLREAGERGIRIVMDLVPNHCSSEHPWFTAARAAAPGSRERARFWIRDGRPDGAGDPFGAPPNNWMGAFGGGAWTRLTPDDPQWYLGTFTPHQPDLDHDHPDVQDMFREVLEFWFDRGVEGFRVDAISPVGKDRDLPDQPPVPPGTPPLQVTWENPHTVFHPTGHDVWRYFRRAVDDYMERHPGRDLMLVGEAYLVSRPDLLAEFASADQFHQVFNFDLIMVRWNRESVEAAVADVLSLNDRGVDPCWTLNNHDVQRATTRLGRADAHLPLNTFGNAQIHSTSPVDVEVGRRRARALIALTMVLPGAVYLYQGEELGLPEWLELPDDRREDPTFKITGGTELGRDGCRVPLPWTEDPASSFGFSHPPADGGDPAPPWLPQPSWWGEFARDIQLDVEDSDLGLYRTLIEARRAHPLAQPSTAEVVDLGPGLVAVRRGTLVAIMNVTAEPVLIDLDHPALATGPEAPSPVLASAPAEMHTPGVVPPDATIWLVG